MNWIAVKRFLTTPVTELRIRNAVRRSYKMKSSIDVVRKYESCKIEYLQAERSKSQELKYHEGVKDALEWVINANQKSD